MNVFAVLESGVPEIRDSLVFISHSRQNSGAALKLCDELRRRGVKTWLDVRELDSGANWNDKVAEAIRTANAFVFLIGPPGSIDQWQKFEWQHVAEQELYLDPSKPLIPVLIGDTEIPGFLKTRVAIHADESRIHFRAIVDRVLGALKEPKKTIDENSVKRGRAARLEALERLREYSRDQAANAEKEQVLRSE